MNLRTELNVRSAPWSLAVGEHVLTIGSCFAQSIGQRFQINKFNAIVNPFGTTYHPMAIDQLLAYSTFQEYPAPHTYLQQEGIFYNYNFHSSQAARTQADLARKLHDQISACHYFLKDCSVLLITYGTAWLYERKDTGESVANCHRVAPAQFSRRLTGAEEIITSFRKTLQALLKVNPNLKVVLTLSPVRHVNDTLPLNSVSKAAIRVACHQLSEEFSQVSYFPAYELLMDDLRDYRFYKDDLIHPTSVAEDYIWAKFGETFFTYDTKVFLTEWSEIRQALDHRAFQPDSPAHQQFLTRTLRQLEKLQSKVNVDQEISTLKSLLVNQPAAT